MNRRQLLGAAAGTAATLALPPPLRAATVAMPIPSTPSFTGMLDRAKAALDAHHDDFQLRDRVAIADFTLHSRELRFYVVDLIGGQITSYLVAHGRGSDPDHTGYLRQFSNLQDSLATSKGAYRTGEIYTGPKGVSMLLFGLDADDSNAQARQIIVHGAPYVSENQIATWGKVGRSEGCFALAPHRLSEVIALLGPGRLLYADKL